MAVGIALADKMRGRDTVTACFFGDGAVAEGEFHESMNLASLWHLPVLFCCENNLYAMGTAIERALVNVDLVGKSSIYRMPGALVDGMDVLAVQQAAIDGTRIVREGGGPMFLELQTYRFRAHSMYDPERYRSKEEVERWRQRDPLVLYPTQLREQGLLEDEAMAAMEAEVAAEIDAAIAAAEAAAFEPVEELTRFVYSERTRP